MTDEEEKKSDPGERNSQIDGYCNVDLFRGGNSN